MLHSSNADFRRSPTFKTWGFFSVAKDTIRGHQAKFQLVIIYTKFLRVKAISTRLNIKLIKEFFFVLQIQRSWCIFRSTSCYFKYDRKIIEKTKMFVDSWVN